MDLQDIKARLRPLSAAINNGEEPSAKELTFILADVVAKFEKEIERLSMEISVLRQELKAKS